MPGIVYIATSLDGFIAREDGGLDWLPQPGEGNDFGFGAFMSGIDALVMGRNTYDTVLGFDGWAYQDTPVFVMTHRDIESPRDPVARVEGISGSPRDVVATLATRGFERLYIDGGQTVQSFLEAGEIHRLLITRIPVLLGQGIPLFGELVRDINFACLRTEILPGGLEQAEYEIVAPAGQR